MSSGIWQAFLALVPPSVTHNDLEPYRRKDGSLGIRKSAALKEAEAAYEARVRAVGVPDEPLGLRGRALHMCVRVCFPCEGVHEEGEPHAAKPDLDNMLKTIIDVLERSRVIANDAKVCAIDAAKAWCDPAGVFVRVDELGGSEER